MLTSSWPVVPAVVVGGERQRREAELGLARELRLLQVRHADHVRAPAPVELRLGARRELRPFHADVRAARVHRGAARARAASRRARARAAGRPDRRTARARRCRGRRRCSRLPAARAVDELVGHDDVPGRDLLAQAADGADRQHATRRRASSAPQMLARNGSSRRQEAVAAAVARQEERAACPPSRPIDDLVGRDRRTASRRARARRPRARAARRARCRRSRRGCAPPCSLVRRRGRPAAGAS